MPIDRRKIDRRKVLGISGAAGVTALAGCYVLWDTSQERFFEEETARELPSDLDVLHIRSGDEHVISGDSEASYGMIRWEEGGRLTMEPGASLGLEDINDE